MRIWIFLLIPFISACVTIVKTGDQVDSKDGLVVCVDSHAAKVGVQILDDGGNAVDAAVAVALALAVTHPQAGNLGGGGFMLIRLAEGDLTSLDYRERAPLASTPGMFLNPDGSVNRDWSDNGFLASGVPGTLAGLYLAHARYGRTPWHKLVEPAYRLAKDGFKVDFDLANAFRKAEKSLRAYPDTVRAFFGPEGKLPDVGDLLMQPDLARTLKEIMEGGREVFYKGSVGKEIIRAVQEGGGIMTARDLETYYAREKTPLIWRYRDVDVVAVGLPSSGGVVLRQMLRVLGGYELKTMDEGQRAHLLAETMRRAYKDRALYLGDDDFTYPPLDKLFSKEYADSLAAQIDMESATSSFYLASDLEIQPAQNQKNKEEGMSPTHPNQTTHFCVADGEGSVVSNTYTLEQSFGCKAVAGRTGILMNNEMRDFNLRPGWTSEDGSVGTDPNLIAPGKRMLSSMCPVILMRKGRPLAAFGSPGGRSIINTILQVVVNLVDLEMTLEEAIRAPRLHHQWFPDKVFLEKTIPWSVKQALKGRGHALEEVDYLGDCHGLFLITEGNLIGGMQGIADQRIDGCAAGL